MTKTPKSDTTEMTHPLPKIRPLPNITTLSKMKIPQLRNATPWKQNNFPKIFGDAPFLSGKGLAHTNFINLSPEKQNDKLFEEFESCLTFVDGVGMVGVNFTKPNSLKFLEESCSLKVFHLKFPDMKNSGYRSYRYSSPGIGDWDRHTNKTWQKSNFVEFNAKFEEFITDYWTGVYRRQRSDTRTQYLFFLIPVNVSPGATLPDTSSSTTDSSVTILTKFPGSKNVASLKEAIVFEEKTRKDDPRFHYGFFFLPVENIATLVRHTNNFYLPYTQSEWGVWSRPFLEEGIRKVMREEIDLFEKRCEKHGLTGEEMFHKIWDAKDEVRMAKELGKSLEIITQIRTVTSALENIERQLIEKRISPEFRYHYNKCEQAFRTIGKPITKLVSVRRDFDEIKKTRIYPKQMIDSWKVNW